MPIVNSVLVSQSHGAVVVVAAGAGVVLSGCGAGKRAVPPPLEELVASPRAATATGPMVG